MAARKGGKQPDRITRPDPGESPFAELGAAIYDELYVPQGCPSARELRNATNNQVSIASIHKILRGSGSWQWSTGEKLIMRLGGRDAAAVWEPRWRRAHELWHAEQVRQAPAPLPGVDEDPVSVSHRRPVSDWDRPGSHMPKLSVAVGSVLSKLRPGAIASHRTRFIVLETVLRMASSEAHRARAVTYLTPTFHHCAAPASRKKHKRSGAIPRVEHTYRLGTTMRQVFDESGENVVLIGDAGMGKSVQLADLVVSLAEEGLQALKAAKEAGVRPSEENLPPIPILIRLAPYQGEPFEEWLVSQVNQEYEVPTAIARRWWRSQALLPVLDGLDEVSQEHRRECARQIKLLRQRNTGLVVSCRTRDYALVALGAATPTALLAPPTRDQVQIYLSAQGDALADVREALDEDTTLWELLTSPLMLAIIHHAYAHRPATELREPGSTGQRRSRVFDAYIRRMVDYRESSYTPIQTVAHLSWLARALHDRNKRAFYLDRLDSSWLADKETFIGVSAVRQSSIYLITGAVATGLAVTEALFPKAAVNGWGALCALLLLIVLYPLRFIARRSNSTDGEKSFPLGRVLSSPLGILCCYGALRILVLVIQSREPYMISSFLTVINVHMWTSFASTDAWMLTRWNPVEEVRWSWKPLAPQPKDKEPQLSQRRRLTLAIVGSGYFGITATIVTASTTADVSWKDQMIVGASLALTALLTQDRLVPTMRERRTLPNEGTRRSARFGITAGALTIAGAASLTAALRTLLATESDWKLAGMGSVLVGLMLGVSRAFRLGLSAVVMHWAVRVSLWRKNDAPRRLLDFLHDAEQRVLLHREGSGFAFPHRLLQQHLAKPPSELEYLVKGHSFDNSPVSGCR